MGYTYGPEPDIEDSVPGTKGRRITDFFPDEHNPWKGKSFPITAYINTDRTGLHKTGKKGIHGDIKEDNYDYSASPSGDLPKDTPVTVHGMNKKNWLAVTAHTPEGDKKGWVDWRYVTEGVLSPSMAQEHLIYEVAAHGVSYYDTDRRLTDEDEFFERNGYEGNQDNYVRMGPDEGLEWGMQYVYIPSSSKDKPGILAVRGTNPGITAGDLQTFFVDTNPETPGFSQMFRSEANRRALDDLFSNIDGNVVVTGHSLGGAVAQMIALEYPEKVSKVVTFQAPGIQREMVNEYNQLPHDQKAKVYHHGVVGDLVHKAGDTNLPGTFYDHDFGYTTDSVPIMLFTILGAWNITTTSFDRLTELSDEGIVRNAPEIIEELTNIQTTLTALMEYLREQVEQFGAAHGQQIFSGENYTDVRRNTGLRNSYYTENLELDQEAINQESSVEVSNSFGYPIERLFAEGVRDVVGNFINDNFTEEEVRAGTIIAARALEDFNDLDLQNRIAALNDENIGWPQYIRDLSALVNDVTDYIGTYGPLVRALMDRFNN